MLRAFLIFALTATAVAAQDGEERGRDLMTEALRLFMRGLMQEMEPAMDDFGTLLDNLDAYYPPEVLPNGDIIIRRKTPLDPALDEDEGGEVDL